MLFSEQNIQHFLVFTILAFTFEKYKIETN